MKYSSTGVAKKFLVRTRRFIVTTLLYSRRSPETPWHHQPQGFQFYPGTRSGIHRYCPKVIIFLVIDGVWNISRKRKMMDNQGSKRWFKKRIWTTRMESKKMTWRKLYYLENVS